MGAVPVRVRGIVAPAKRDQPQDPALKIRMLIVKPGIRDGNDLSLPGFGQARQTRALIKP
jgi:hypothetical protein